MFYSAADAEIRHDADRRPNIAETVVQKLNHSGGASIITRL